MIKLNAFPTIELEKDDQIFITIALELHSTSVSSDQDKIQLNNLLDDAKKRVKEELDKDLAKKLLLQIDEARKHDIELITYRGGLALYITQDEIYYYHLGIPVSNLLNVSKAPNLTPLIENYQYSNQYFVLVLNRENIRLFEGDTTSVKEISLDDDAPKTLEIALGTEKTGGNSASVSAGGGESAMHGHTETSKEKEIDRENYFRIVDKFIHENYTAVRDLPLILFALVDNQAVFRKISKSKFLLPEGIEESGANVNLNQVQDKAIKKNAEIIAKQKEVVFSRFRETTTKYRIDNQLNDLAMSATEGRIDELIVNKGYRQRGIITDQGEYEEVDHDFVKRLITKVIAAKGKVFIVDQDEMPVGINLSARLRY
ncbi:baeRF6 domain-containing protein [Fundicoccus ignavus]|uniref:Bacterial archaeo-eukaryotic release factor family 6 domain-containing protein n=1 Tax=Fundicoccus ignavus TaxID=2664442 RepID=A0A844BZM3_9LACT|nr:hypothetical protein [Fundicoccus ignavus]MRJ47508.1 hypothetical protein [Fundicoccus ignavus]